MAAKINTVHQLNPLHGKRAALYVRVSTEEQGEKYGPQFQERDMITWAERNGVTVIQKHIYKDIGYSGASRLQERKELPKLIEAAKRREFDVVLVWKLDRFFRKMLYLLEVEDQFHSMDIGLISVTEGINTQNQMSRATLLCMGMGAELERHGILERTKAGRLAAVRAGKWVGGKHPPYGFTIDKDQKISIDREEAAIVEKVFHWFVHDRLTTYEIQQHLNAMKIPTKADKVVAQRKAEGKKVSECRTSNPACFWGLPSIRYMLNNETYTGVYYYGRRTTKKDHVTGKKKEVLNPRSAWEQLTCPAIIERSVWETAQERLTENKRLSRKNSTHDYMFSGKIECDCCESPFVGYLKKKFKNKEVIAEYPQYRCRRSTKTKAAKPCKNRNISEAILEENIWSQIEEFLSDPQLYLNKIEERENRVGGVAQMKEEMCEIEDALTELEKESKRVFGLYEKGLLYQDAGEIDRRGTEITKQREKLQARKNAISNRILTRQQEKERLTLARGLANRYRKALTNLDRETKKRIIHTLVNRVIIRKRKIRVELKLQKRLTKEIKRECVSADVNQKLTCGAQEKTRTSTGIYFPLAPQASASTIPPPGHNDA